MCVGGLVRGGCDAEGRGPEGPSNTYPKPIPNISYR